MPDYTSPKPIDPLWFTRGRFINATCATCKRSASIPLASVRAHRDDQLYTILARLRCSVCGVMPIDADVTVRPRFRT